MTQVTVGENEGIESALRRFKRQVSKAGIFADLKRLVPVQPHGVLATLAAYETAHPEHLHRLATGVNTGTRNTDTGRRL